MDSGSQSAEFCGRLRGMARPLHRPSPRQAICLAAIAILALGYGFSMRYAVVEQSAIGIACGNDGTTWLCASRRTVIALFTPQVFGIAALGAALLNLVRPSVVLWAVALFASGAGIVLYNVALSALAVALLILSLARPVPEAS
jgi:hypothetical protein